MTLRQLRVAETELRVHPLPARKTGSIVGRPFQALGQPPIQALSVRGVEARHGRAPERLLLLRGR